MRIRRTWEECRFGERPLCFEGWPKKEDRPATLIFDPAELLGAYETATARLYYKNGWTAIVFWNSDLFLVDEFLSFEDMMGLLRKRSNKPYLKQEMRREYVHE